MTQYKLTMHVDVYELLKLIADKHYINVSDVLRRGIKWVLLEAELEEIGGQILVKKEEGETLVQILPY